MYTKNVHLNRGKCDGAWDFFEENTITTCKRMIKLEFFKR